MMMMMMDPTPHEGFRRRVMPTRRGDNEAFGNNERDHDIRTQRPMNRRRRHATNDTRPTALRLSHLYCLASGLVALLAVITSPGPVSKSGLLLDNVRDEDSSWSVEKTQALSQKKGGFDFFKNIKALFSPPEPKVEEKRVVQEPVVLQHKNVPGWLRWMLPPPSKEEPARVIPARSALSMFAKNFLDPSLLNPSSSTPTDIIDKILTSTPRLLAIANLLLAITYLLHTAVADLFLGGFYQEPGWAGRERLGGFLVFKLLLISAVVAPDTLDLLILLTWYTLLSFLRSLAHLAAATTSHTTQSGQPPRPGVLRLLIVVLFSNFLAAAVCVALFHGAGWGMVLLLTCDCALLAVDVICHVLRHICQVLEEIHSSTIGELEERQIELHQHRQDQREPQPESSNAETSGVRPETSGSSEENSNTETTEAEQNEPPREDVNSLTDELLPATDEDALEESRQLDRRMEVMELAHARRISVLETTVFSLQLLIYALTVAHFLHIWSLHGLQFTLIDGVLALHLQSAISSASKKIAERRNLHRIARDLDGMFEDATELDLRKASATGDVCCICLGTMALGNVKKVRCGHLYHTHCLREVVERARSIEAARCPLCRASVLDGRQPNNGSAISQPPAPPRNPVPEPVPPRAPAPEPPRQGGGDAVQQANEPGEHALFRFSTEGILPAWLPLPAFSFEVVRRAPATADPPAGHDANAAANNNNAGGGERPNIEQRQQHLDQAQQSFLRRIMQLAGAMPMSAEEEARALEQLVDMFPQFARADLMRELRERGSAEAVVETVFMGNFSGVAIGGGNAPAPGAAPAPEVQ